ncbi:MAG: hypothetical protein ACT4N4_09250, partial [Rhodospirillales bacterium]
AALGAATGILSWLATAYLPYLRGHAGTVLFDPIIHGERFNYESILPGFFFGGLVAWCCHRYGARDRLLLGLAAAVTVVAWLAAHDLSRLAYSELTSYSKEITQDRPAPGVNDPSTRKKMEKRLPYVLGLAGIAGGAIGGLGTAFAVSIAHRGFRRIESLGLAVIVAAMLGTLLELIFLEWLLLLAVWQSAVIATIARGLAQAQAETQA